MKASMYFNYALRALLRGRQHTLLAVFCITVGVMAVVALQLVGFMLQNSLSTNAREANDGDITVIAQGAPLKASDLTFFTNLKQEDTITAETAILSASGTLQNGGSATHAFSIEAVDPHTFPLLSQPTFATPGNGSIAQLLTNKQVIVTQQFLTTYHKHVGDSFAVYVRTPTGSGVTLTASIAGVIENTGAFAQSGNLLLISAHDYLEVVPAVLANYTLINIATADQAHTDKTVKEIMTRFPLVTTLTATDVLKGQQSSIDLINKFLEIAGLVSLLIGGVGVINTMQVVLSRRKTEIAMLKTVGYHRSDLFLLFGLEAGLLGLIGGILGASAAIGVSYLIRILLENLGSNIPFALNLNLILGGVGVGTVTALIFGLLPIVQAANIRPLHVLRELENKSLSSRLLTFLLLVLFSMLFCFLAIVILNGNVLLGIIVTYGTFTFLLILSLIFGLIVCAVSKLPVPETLHIKHVLLILPGIVISVLVYRVLPVFGLFLLALSLMGIVIVFVPRQWKLTIKMALRNIGRQRIRTTATLMALFIGVFGIGIDIGFGQDLGRQITDGLNQNSPYNLVVTTSGQEESNALRTHLHIIPGLTDSREDPFAASLPIAINGRPSQQELPAGDTGQQDLNLLGGIEGYDLTRTLPAQTITEGRNLTKSDATTNNVLVSQVMTSKGWAGMTLKPGDSVTLSSRDGKVQKTVLIVGIISVPTSFETLGEVLGSSSLVNALNATQSENTTVFYMKVPPSQFDQAVSTLARIAPNASVQNLSDAGTSFLQRVTSFLDVIIAIASLSLLAAVVIIANSVALAMLERRRELGILKSVGYTSQTILSQVLIENGITGGVGAFIATLLAAGSVTIGSKGFFNNSLTLTMQPVVVVSMIIVPVLLALVTAVLVAWNAVRVRPLIVLKYE
ncbi:ABC transporter permease [Tengunoibacter tsumagoiensis]|uniref:ABC transporter permease n=1 Tax=Tengunoibacter tsumagoiensis TaxID=2014871 RepID=A0A402A739_9CHLR|nr:FtsX-like permease family protein [Tengunoibacter tsumagoiensis]GCE14855.1 hypothetical protein KTT_47140 [Tengunoibacter tsumagoiensis]